MILDVGQLVRWSEGSWWVVFCCSYGTTVAQSVPLSFTCSRRILSSFDPPPG